MLVRNGADVKIADNSGYSPLDDCALIAGECLHLSTNVRYAEGDVDSSVLSTMLHRGVDFRSGLEKGLKLEDIDSDRQKQFGLVFPDFDADDEKLFEADNEHADNRMSNFLLAAYAQMDHEELARCTKDCFLEEGLHSVLMKGILLANLSQTRGLLLRSRDAYAASEMAGISNRLQLAVASLIDIQSKVPRSGSAPEKGSSFTSYLATTRQGDKFLSTASKFECKAILAHPRIQSYMSKVWWDWLSEKPWQLQNRLFAFTALVMLPLAVGQILIVPVVALWPPLVALDVVRTIFDIPCIKFLVQNAVNIGLAILVSFYVPEILRDDNNPNHRYAILGLVVSDLWNEILLFTDGFNTRTMRNELNALTFRGQRSEYMIDPFNIFDAFATTTTSLAMLLGCIEPHNNYTSSLLSAGAFCQWLRCLRLLAMLNGLGPLVLMGIKMINDIVTWLSLLVVVLLASSFSLYVLYRSSGSGYDGDTTRCDAEFTPFANAAENFKMLLEGSLTGNPYYKCISHSTNPITGEILAMLFQVSTTLLLVNMLIAQMAKTFDAVWESQDLNFMYLRARTTLSWDSAPFVGPPFNLLSWPYLICVKVYHTTMDIRRGEFKIPSMIRRRTAQIAPDGDDGAPRRKSDLVAGVLARGKKLLRRGAKGAVSVAAVAADRATEVVIDAKNQAEAAILPGRSGATTSHSAASGGKSNSDNDDANSDIFGGTTGGKTTDLDTGSKARLRSVVRKLQSRGSSIGQYLTSEAPKKDWIVDTKAQGLFRAKVNKVLSDQEIVDFISSYMADHEDEMSQEERWRTQLQKKVNSRFLELERAMKTIVTNVRESKRACSDLRVQQALDREAVLQDLKDLKDMTKRLGPKQDAEGEASKGGVISSPRAVKTPARAPGLPPSPAKH